MKQILLTLFAALIFIVSAHAAELSPQGPFRALDDNGDPCVECELYTYEASTSTPKATYTSRSALVANTNPVVLDSDGYADVWLGDGSYKFILKDSTGGTLWTVDEITGSAAAAFGDQIVSLATNTAITTAYENNLILTTASPTLSLASAVTVGEGFSFAVKNVDSGSTTIDPSGTQTIDGALTLALELNQWAIIYSDGANWQTTDSRLVDNSVTTGKIFNDAVTLAKIDGDAAFANKLIGYDAAGDPANISVTGAATVTASVLNVPVMQNYLSGLILSNDTDTDHDINITAGQAVDSTNAKSLILASETTKRGDAAWAAGNDAGGMFTGAIANNTTYHLCLIEKDSDLTIDAGFDTSITCANKPVGYTKYRRIGSLVTDSSANFLGFINRGNDFILKTPVLDHTTGATAGTSAITVTLTSIPTGTRVRALLNTYVADNANHLYLSSLDTTDIAPATSGAPLVTMGGGAVMGAQAVAWTNTSSQIRARQSTNSANGFKIATLGWMDDRGR